MSIKQTTHVDVTLDTIGIGIDSIHDLAEKNTHCIEQPCIDSPISGIKKEYSIVGDALYASVSADDAPQWLVDIVDRVVRDSIQKGQTNYNTLVQDVRNAIDSLSIAKNTYVEKITFNTDVNNLISSRLQQLNNTLDNKFATVTALETTKAGLDQAIATKTSDLKTQFTKDITSRITTLKNSLTAKDNSLALDIKTLDTAFKSQSAQLSGYANATQQLQSYVGLDSNSKPNSTGILAELAVIKKQTDGVLDTYAGKHEVVSGSLSNGNDTRQLEKAQWPYAMWLPMTGTQNPTESNRDVLKGTTTVSVPVPPNTVYKNTTNSSYWIYSSTGWTKISEQEYKNNLKVVRKAHVGDTYIVYTIDANTGDKVYTKSYKFIETITDTTSPYSTDADGFGWALVTDTDAQKAILASLNAMNAGRGKTSQFLAWGASSKPVDQVVKYKKFNNVTKKYDEVTETIPAASYLYKFYNNVLYGKDNSSWKPVSLIPNSSHYIDKGDTVTAYNPDTTDYTNYVYNGANWQQIGPDGIIAKSKFLTELQNEVVGSDGLVTKAISKLRAEAITYSDVNRSTVTNEFEYDATSVLGGKSYNAGFGMKAKAEVVKDGNGLILEDGTNDKPFQSTFWVNANKFEIKNPTNANSKVTWTVQGNKIRLGGNLVVDGELNAKNLKGGYIQTGDFTKADVTYNNNQPKELPQGYTGTVMDSRGVRVYENGQLRVKIGNLS